jgi:hypothetical protein
MEGLSKIKGDGAGEYQEAMGTIATKICTKRPRVGPKMTI